MTVYTTLWNDHCLAIESKRQYTANDTTELLRLMRCDEEGYCNTISGLKYKVNIVGDEIHVDYVSETNDKFRDIMGQLGPVGMDFRMAIENGRSGCYGKTGLGGTLPYSIAERSAYVDIDVRSDNVDSVVDSWNSMTGGDVRHNYKHRFCTNANVRGHKVLKEGSNTVTKTIIVHNPIYDDVMKMYIEAGLCDNEKDFYDLQYDLYERGITSLLRENEEVIKEKVETIYYDNVNVVRLNYYLGDKVDNDVLEMIVNRIKNLLIP